MSEHHLADHLVLDDIGDPEHREKKRCSCRVDHMEIVEAHDLGVVARKLFNLANEAWFILGTLIVILDNLGHFN